ncbi:hypothetical protein FACS189461_3330 [Spirochaetia bacterium]|nr:hypothetical protein FACS189461_3330 [Spirochaetia bacterium]
MEYKQCACCGEDSLDASVKFFDICPVCGWEDDPVQRNNPDYDGGANHLSLNEARRAFAEGKDLRLSGQAAIQRHGDISKEENSEKPAPLTAVIA